MTESEHLIAETLRLDAQSIAASIAWNKRPLSVLAHNDHLRALEMMRDHNAEFAPRLARMLKVAMDALNLRATMSFQAAETLAEIEKIAKGES